jgi:hypothetical protein
MLTVNNLSVQFGKRILFDEVKLLHTVIFMALDQWRWKIYFQNNSG